MRTRKKDLHAHSAIILPLALAVVGAGTIGSAKLSLIAAPDASSGELGVGIWATMVGGGLLLCGLWCAMQAWQSCPPAQTQRKAPLFSPAFCGMFFACLLWIAMLPLVGWLCASALALALACRSAQASLLESLILIVLLLGGLYLGVDVLLNTPLPRGIVGDWLTAISPFTLFDNFYTVMPAPFERPSLIVRGVHA